MKYCRIFKSLVCYYILFFSCLVNGQNIEVNSYTKLQNTLSNFDKTRLSKLYKRLDNAKQSIDSMIIFNRIASIYLKSSYYMKAPRYDSIIYYSDKAILTKKNNKHKKHLYQYLLAINLKAASYNKIGYTNKAMENFNTIIKITDTISDPNYFFEKRQTAITYLTIFYAEQKNYELAIRQYQALLSYVKRKGINPDKISSIVYLNYANFHRKINKLKVAVKYAEIGMDIAKKNNLPHREALSYIELSHINLNLNDNVKADEYSNKAIKILTNKVNYVGLLSECYYIKSLIAKQDKNFVGHIKNAKKAFELIDKKAVSEKKLEIGQFLYDAYKEIGDFEKANNILEQIYDIEKKLFDLEELKKNMLLEIQRRDENIELAEEKNETLNHIIICIIFLFIMAVVITVIIYRDRKNKIKLTKEIIEKNKELKQIDRIKSNFFSNISHELQTPLTLITGPLELALQHNEQQLSSSLKSKIKMALRSTNSLRTLVNDLLDLSKLEAKKLSLDTQYVDLYTFLKTNIQKFVSLTKNKKITLNYSFENLKSYYATIDAKKLEKILSNLLSNAIKYTNANGIISVHGKVENNTTLIITINDTGVGISKDDLPFIFDRYFQSKDASKPLEGGYGIGLSLVKEFVELMNGTIQVQSEISKGTGFLMTFPLTYVKKTIKTQHTDFQNYNTEPNVILKECNNHKIKKKYKILIVEDYLEMQQFISSILSTNYQLIIVNNGKEALSKLKTDTVDLIISDVMMPVMDGFMLLEIIKKSNVYNEIPIIMLTALSDVKCKLNALTIGVDDYITKPFVATELLARVYNLLKRNKKRIIINNQERELLPLSSKATNDFINQLEKINKSDIELITKVADIIEQNFENSEFKLNHLEKKIHLSERQLRRKIKLNTGLSPKKFQQEIQLLKARTSLENEEYTNVKAVALSVGIQNTTRFSKLYVARFGKHPNSYFTY